MGQIKNIKLHIVTDIKESSINFANNQYTSRITLIITMVQQIATKDDFDAFLKANKKVAVDFTAVWCGPCRMIGPKFEAFAEHGDFKGVIAFIKVDVDENGETAEAQGISAMPTFKFYLDGEKVEVASLGSSRPPSSSPSNGRP